MLKFSRLKQWKTHPYLWHWLVNVIVAGFWSYYVYKGVAALRTTSLELPSVALLIRNTTLTLMFLVRRPSKLSSRRAKEWLVAIAGTFCSYFYVVEGTKPIYEPLALPTYIIMGWAILLSVVAITHLGRSFGIVPANRGIKTKGFYAIVRHLIYLLYVVHDLALILYCSSISNLLIFISFILITYSRARYEERILKLDPAYQQYVQKTRYMFLPGII